MRAIPKASLTTRIRALTVEELAELDLATDEAATQYSDSMQSRKSWRQRNDGSSFSRSLV
jgi:hypothetical protein